MAGKQNFVLPHDGTAADGMNADLRFGTLFTLRMAVVNIFRRLSHTPGNRIRNHQRGAARGVDFLVVVLFNDFHVESVPKNGFGHFCQSDQQIDSQRHVAGIEHGNGFTGLAD